MAETVPPVSPNPGVAKFCQERNSPIFSYVCPSWNSFTAKLVESIFRITRNSIIVQENKQVEKRHLSDFLCWLMFSLQIESLQLFVRLNTTCARNV